MDDALETSIERLRDHLRRPHARKRNHLTENAAYTVNQTDPPASPFFSTAHFDGHLSVLVRASRLAEIGTTELAELIQDAWLSRASKKRAESWLAAQSAQET